MPAIIAAVSGIATSTYVSGLAAVKVYGAVAAATIGALAGAVVSGIVGSALISKSSAGSFDATASSILTNINVNNAAIPVIYGTRLSGGTIVFMDIPINKQWFYVNLVFSEGTIEGYSSYFFNTQPAKASDGVLINEFFGTEGQTANTVLINEFPHYTINHRLRGTAYVTFHFKFKPFPAGLPLITALVKGIKIYDPRTASVQWSDNPALCLRDYLRSNKYGRGINPSLIDDASFILAANYCDELILGSYKRYTCNGVAETQTSSLGIIKQILSSCRGMLIFSGGAYKIIIDKPDLAGFTFSEDNIIGGWKILLGSKKTQYNRMRANFFNKDKEYQPDIAIIDSGEYYIEDDRILSDLMIDLPFTTNGFTAKYIIAINLNQSRKSISCEFTSTIEGLLVEVGDVVYINHKTPGWDTHNSGLGKKFRIMRVTLQNNDEVRIIANEYDDGVYNVVIGEPEAPPGPSVPSHDSSICLPPSNFRYTIYRKNEPPLNLPYDSFSARWHPSPDPFLEKYEVYYAPMDELLPTSERTWQVSYTTELYHVEVFVDVAPPLYVSIIVRAVNTFGVKSEWLQ